MRGGYSDGRNRGVGRGAHLGDARRWRQANPRPPFPIQRPTGRTSTHVTAANPRAIGARITLTDDQRTRLLYG